MAATGFRVPRIATAAGFKHNSGKNSFCIIGQCRGVVRPYRCSQAITMITKVTPTSLKQVCAPARSLLEAPSRFLLWAFLCADFSGL
jgi:hypothetical protein